LVRISSRPVVLHFCCSAYAPARARRAPPNQWRRALGAAAPKKVGKGRCRRLCFSNGEVECGGGGVALICCCSQRTASVACEEVQTLVRNCLPFKHYSIVVLGQQTPIPWDTANILQRSRAILLIQIPRNIQTKPPMRPWMYSNLMPAHIKHRCPARRQVCISKRTLPPRP
jgi:hypothetical protein